MIARITGRLEQLDDGMALIATATGLTYEVLVPAYSHGALGRKLNQDVSLHTIHYVEGDPSHGAQTPRLVGFLTVDDRRFFRVFTTVKGIGNRKALRALVHPIAEVAAAIQARDAKFLVSMPEIGKRLAEQIIAELHGKVLEFAGAAAPAAGPVMSEASQAAIALLVQLGERPADAASLVERVLAVAPELSETQQIIQHVYKIKGRP